MSRKVRPVPRVAACGLRFPECVDNEGALSSRRSDSPAVDAGTNEVKKQRRSEV